MALFRIEKANTFDVQTSPLPTRTQDGKQIHQGLEVGITGKLTDNLTIVAGGTLMDLKVTKATNPALQGKKPTGAASQMAKVTAEYRVPAVPGLSISGGAYYTGKKYYNASNTETVPAYTVFDAGVRYATKLGSYPTTFNFTVQNITDKVYWSNTSGMGDPRTFAFTVRASF
jgi:iron complex outermembrane receptor protein